MLNIYLNHLKTEGKSNHTIKAYETDIRMILEYINKPEAEIRFADIEMWKQFALTNWTKTTVNRKIVSIKTYFSFLCDMELIENNPIVKVKQAKINQVESQKSKSEYVPMEQAIRLIDGCNNLRDKAIIAVGLTTGLRFNEIRNLTVEDYQQGTIKVVTKGSKYRLVKFNETCQKYVDEYLETRMSDLKYLFVSTQNTQIDNDSFNRTLARICKKVGLPKMTAHSMRHSAISKVVNEYGIHSASKWVGHSSVTITEKYSHSTDEELIEISDSIVF